MRTIMKATAAIMLMTVVMMATGCKNNKLNGHEYVDLGLPSGTMWATCNVGAEMPKDYGNYYAWGETEPKNVYDEASYKFFKEGKYTKYCDDTIHGYNGLVDDLKTLQPEDDAATANWGAGWAMPTTDQWYELETNCVWTWNKNGYEVVGSNGNSIFLPAAGDKTNDNENTDAGILGIYWSNSIFPECSVIMAYGVVFQQNTKSHSLECRRFGMSVRPVCSSKK